VEVRPCDTQPSGVRPDSRGQLSPHELCCFAICLTTNNERPTTVFVDSHAHLDGKQFDSDREQVIARAREAGVRTMVAIGNGDGPPQFDAGIQLADMHPFMYATIGIHPHEARLASDHAYSEMEQLARHPKGIPR